MRKIKTFDLENITKDLISIIAFFEINYPIMGDPGGVMFITANGDEYIIGEEGKNWRVEDIIGLFPEIYEVYRNQDSGVKDEYGFAVSGRWKIIPEFAGVFLVRIDYFEKFYSIFQKENKIDKEFPYDAARLLFRKECSAPNKRMVYIKTKEWWDKYIQEVEARRETEQNRLLDISDIDVPWIKYTCLISEGYIRFFVRKNKDGTLSGFRWLIQVQKEQYQEGSYKLDAPIECYNLFLQKYENITKKIFDEFEVFYCTYVKYNKAGKFVRSYKNLEKAKEAVFLRNEWIGWGNVNKKNVYMIDYEFLKARIESDSEFFIF